jgi:DNA-binding MarR family transcriptional regulator
MRPGHTEPPTIADLAVRLGNAAQSSVSRYMEGLVGSAKTKPMGGAPLLRSVENPMNRRTKVVTMTNEGRALVRKLVNAME